MAALELQSAFAPLVYFEKGGPCKDTDLSLLFTLNCITIVKFPLPFAAHSRRVNTSIKAVALGLSAQEIWYFKCYEPLIVRDLFKY